MTSFKITILVFGVTLSIATLAQSEIDLYNRGNVQLQYQNYDEAIALLTKAILAKPDFADAYAVRGDCYYFLKEYETAIENYLKDDGLKKSRSSYSLATCYALTNKLDLAFKYLEANLGSEYKIAQSYIEKDANLDAMKKDARWSALMSKKWYSAYDLALEAADIKTSSNDLAGALTEQNKAIQLIGDNDKGYGARALTYIRMGEMNKALSDLDQAVRLKPQSVYYGNRAYVQNKLQNVTAALSDYEKAVQLDPTNLVYYDLAIARYSNGKKNEALEAIRKHTTYYTRDEMGHYFSAIIASELNQFTEAVSTINKAIEINQSVPQLFMKRADIYFLMKKYEEAVADYDKAIELDANYAEAYYIRGNAKATMMNKAGACTDWRKAVELGFSDQNNYIRDLCN